ncbi:MAG: YlxR family protein [Mycobacterium sp.]
MRIPAPGTARATSASCPARAVLNCAAMTVDCFVIQRETPSPETERAHRRAEGPVRTCVGCRKRELAVELLRVVAVSVGNGSPAVTVDQAGNLPGRGAWLHPDDRCLQAAIRRRAFARALRITGSPDTSAVVEHFEKSKAPGGRGQENR